MLKYTGVPSKEELAKIYPSEERLAQGPVAIIECFQEIPCNPCATACKRGAILPFVDINHLPTTNDELCNGCALCVANCPGLAIVILDMTYSDTEALIKLPYEFLPLPQEGDIVPAVNRAGEVVGKGKVEKVLKPKSFDRTAVISLVVDKALAHEVRTIRVEGEKDNA